jgi:photosystem II stability/assembly factor-like uncharacterized protein
MMHRRFILANVLFCMVLLLPLAQLHAQGPDVNEPFDDPALSGWEHAPEVRVEDGALRVPANTYAFYFGEWPAFTLSVRVRMEGEGELVIGYYGTDQGIYTLVLPPGAAVLMREEGGVGAELAGVPAPIPLTDWAQVTIQVTGNQHTVSINGEQLLSATDPNPLPPGGLLLHVAGAGVGWFDDLVVQPGPGGAAPPPSDADAPPAAATTGTPAYAAGAWTFLGGPPGGLGYDIRMQPDNPDIIYVTDAHAGVHKSIDGGQTWFPANEGIQAPAWGDVPIFCLTIDPHDYNAIWAGTQNGGHVYYSADAAQSWEARDAGISFEGRSVRGITIDPNDSNIVYVATEVADLVWMNEGGYEEFDSRHARVKGEVYKSTDRGQSWTRVWYGDNLARYVWVDPRNSDRVYVSTGIFDRDAANGRVLEGDWGGVGVLRSDDGGQTWTVLDEQHGLGGRYITSLYMHPTNPDLLLGSITGTAERPGVYVTRDGGDSWECVLDTDGWGVESVEIAERNTDIWYAAGEGRVWRSDDAGASWQEFELGLPGRVSGIPIDIQVDPRDPYRLFVNNYGGGNFLSEDGGATWQDASQGYTGLKMTGHFTVSPDDPKLVLAHGYISPDGGHTWIGIEAYDGPDAAFYPLPQGGMGILATDSVGHAWHSTDNGATWTATLIVDLMAEVAAGRSNSDVQSNVLGMAPADPQVVYLGYGSGTCIEGALDTCADKTGGFYRSTDSGHSWEALRNAPFFGTVVLGIAVHPEDSAHLYVATVSGLYESRDGGANWTPLSGIMSDFAEYAATNPDAAFSDLSAPIHYDVAIDPFDPGTLYVTTLPSGIWISHDGGQSWQNSMAGMDPNEPVHQILPDPNRPGVLYVSSAMSGVFYSTDGGQMWQRLSDGLTHSAVHGLALSSDGAVLYAGTIGGGAFRLGTP